MATGLYKNGVAIIVTYQSVNKATGLTIKMDVYDETHALDAGKSVAAMTEIGTTGRYYATFTPDAEGEWILMMYNGTDNTGQIVKAYAVAGHNLDEVGDNIDAVKAKTDLIGSSVAPAGEYNTQMGTGERASATALATTDGKVDVIDTNVDGVKAKTDLIGASVALETGGKLATIETATGATGGIRGADGDSLKTLSDQIDAVSSPAMVG